MGLPLIAVLAAEDLDRVRPEIMMSARERAILVTLLREIGAVTVVEIGINEGRCAEILLKNVPSICRYIGVDVEVGYVTSLPTQRAEVPGVPGQFALGDPRLELIIRLRGSLDLVPADLPVCDAMLIDGDHGRIAVEWDSLLARARVRPGGLILWHDYYFANPDVDVREVLDRLAETGMPIRHIEGTSLAILRR
jgi:predicted O-methyltransferase YrrM